MSESEKSENPPPVKEPEPLEVAPGSDDPDSFLRLISVLSYFIVLVILGLPIWWYTTRIYRAPLPLEEIIEGKAPSITAKEFGMTLSLSYDVLITIVNPDPQSLNIELDGEELEDSLEPFLKIIEPVADFIVKSQWLYLVDFGNIPKKVNSHYILEEQQLPHILTPLERKLWSHLSPRPCVNLVLYVSPCDRPLFIQDKFGNKLETNSFLSPRWGGILIENPNKTECETNNYKPNLERVTKIFVAQMMKMLALEDLSGEQLYNLEKKKTEELLSSAWMTLKSLSKLLSEISTIVISDEVAKKIEISLMEAKIAEEKLKTDDVVDALSHAREAFGYAEDAFSDSTLLEQLYFPDDQKYAVYIPLYLPIMIPVFMALLSANVRKWMYKLFKKLK